MQLDRRLLRLARASSLALLLTILLGFAAGIATVLQAGLLSRVVDRVFLQGFDRLQAGEWLAWLAIVIVARAGFVWASDVCAASASRRIKIGLRRRLYQCLLHRGPAYHSEAQAGELTHTLLDGVDALDAYFSQYLPGLALAAVVPLTMLAAVFPADRLSAIVLLVTAPLIPIFMTLIGSAAQAVTQRQWLLLSRMSAYFLDILQGLTTLKVLGRSRSQAAAIARVGDQYRRATLAVLRITFLSALVLELVATLSTAVVAVQIGLRLLYGRLSFEQAFFVLLLAPEFYQPLRSLGTRFHAGMSGAAAADRIFTILDENDTNIAANPSDTEVTAASAHDSRPPTVRIENVSIAYRANHPALQNVNIEIPAGETAAVVGPSGGGKSTLAALLVGFIFADSGRVTINGRASDEITLEERRAQVAWVPQLPYLFNESVLENIRMARPAASLEEVLQAARLAGAHDFITELPQGYATRIGEGGARLSGGEAQRLALSRAFLRDAHFIIMDEPTAHLDPASEALLQTSLDRLSAGRTTLIIAHRLNTVRRSSRIYYLDGGRVITSGTHAELVERSPQYRSLVQAYAGGTPPVEAAPSASTPIEPPGKDPGERLGFASILPAAAPFPAATVADFATATPQSAGRVLGRLLGLLGPHAGRALLSVLAGAATILAGVGLIGASAYIVSAAALHPSVAVLQVAIVGVRFFGLARGVFRYLERLFSHDLTLRLLADLRARFYTALEPLAPARLLESHSGDLLARILGDIAWLENFYVRAVAPPLAALPVGIVVTALLWRFDAGIALFQAALWIAAGTALPILSLGLSRGFGRRSIAARAELSSALVAGIQGMPDLLAYNQAHDWSRRIDAHSRALAGAQASAAAANGLHTALSGLAANLGMLAVVTMGIPLVRSGALDGVYLAALALIAQAGFEAIAPLPVAAQYLESSLQAGRRLFAIMDSTPVVSEPPAVEKLADGDPHAAAVTMPLAEVHLAVRGLGFRYPGGAGPETGEWALRDISFDLPPGGRLAVVGPSGAGKSTLAGLLLRFWEAQTGEIALDGRDVRRMASADVRRYFGVAAQRDYLFNASVGENLRLARPDAGPEEIIAAAQTAQIHDFIESLPEGYETQIGERGLRLSGGERRRLAVARALLRDAPLLLLDEPTAGLDPLTEQHLLDAVLAATQPRSLLWITHRLVRMEHMDEILVLDGGRIVERGAHDALLNSGGLYRRLWDLQTQILRES